MTSKKHVASNKRTKKAKEAEIEIAKDSDSSVYLTQEQEAAGSTRAGKSSKISRSKSGSANGDKKSSTVIQ